jgi:alkanesulfonate monooxygenase SsuD/methylene tetrahydromethanopterin reductase-like flavin-dependent oxidoreductase (luciferase family)
VIRGIWDVTQRRGLSVNGEHYRVRVAKRGPGPAHDISIWLGARKPRMLELTGAKADGWLPSLAHISPDQKNIPISPVTNISRQEAATTEDRL